MFQIATHYTVFRQLGTGNHRAPEMVISRGSARSECTCLRLGFEGGPASRDLLSKPLEIDSDGGMIAGVRSVRAHTGKPRTATITATEHVMAIELSKADIDHIATSHPDVRATLEEFYNRRAQETVEAVIRKMRGEG